MEAAKKSSDGVFSPVGVHVVAFNVPYPPDYGGVIDIFYKIKALHGLGIRIHLHCFRYGRAEQPELNAFCETVYYYSRRTDIFKQVSLLPFIVFSRKNSDLLRRLATDNLPILFEGLHSCYYLPHKALQNKVKLVRMHNIEFEYYEKLAHAEKKVWKKWYYRLESLRLQRFQSVLAAAQHIFAISPNDAAELRKHFSSVHLVLPFHPFDRVVGEAGQGRFILFHGDLSVADNDQTAQLLIRLVFSKLSFSCVVAGRQPTDALRALARQHPNVALVASPDEPTMRGLVAAAHIHVLWSNQSSGMKLKLLHALFAGRFCVANAAVAAATGLERLCILENEMERLPTTLIQLMGRAFEEETLALRREVLARTVDNLRNSEQIAACLKK